MLTIVQFKKLALIVFLALFVTVLSIALYIIVFGLSDQIHKADVLVVLGNQVDPNGQPSPRLKARLDKAIQLYQQGFAPNIIVSGGIESDGTDEALSMKSYLLMHNIPEARIFSDNQGDDTYSTARNVSVILDRKGWTSVIVVSQFYHLARSTFAIEQFGVSDVYSAHADFYELRDVYSLAREVIALIAYRVRPFKYTR